jgi:succinate dehydrogenase/fumarate reductase flavoprotein subunit
MGGIRVDANMETRIEGLYAAGEAVGGANGANRLSGNAITEAFVFGHVAGTAAGRDSEHRALDQAPGLAAAATERLAGLTSHRAGGRPPVAAQFELQEVMWEKAGPFRTGDRLAAALERIHTMQKKEFSQLAVREQAAFNLDLHDAFELRAMMSAAEAVVHCALARTESRGAHQREDFPDADERFLQNQTVELRDGVLMSRWRPVNSTGRAPTDG